MSEYVSGGIVSGGGMSVRFVPWARAEEVDPASLNITADECILNRAGMCVRFDPWHRHDH